MKLSIRSVFLALLISAGVQCTASKPMKIVRTLQGQSELLLQYDYFFDIRRIIITNEPTGNFVVSVDIGSDGQLTLPSAYATGGLGLHTIAGATGVNTGADGLNSQGSVSVSAASSMLATVNAGSHTVSLFKINETNPSDLVMVGEPIGTGGQFPTSVAFNSAGDTLCVLNGGAINGVSCFHVNQTSGLQIIPETTRYLPLNQTTPATTGSGGTVSQILFSEDNTQLFVSVKGNLPGPPAVVGYLAVWDINSNGSLSEKFMPITPPKNGNNPFGITLVNGRNAVIAADTQDGFTIFDLSDGSKLSSVDVNVLGAICWSTYSPKTGNYYMIDAGGAVFEVNINSNLEGTVVQQYNSTNLIGLFDGQVASLQTNDFLYILAENFSTIVVMSLNAPGKAQQIQSLDVAATLISAGIPISSSNQGMATFVKSS
ncbi:hypothetical protein BT96DRAFT_964644 [Gymnopus androsaceus JB14]|uniref:Isomerase YbhE n=1 Tax=Gymnopus androsaceus JB14 TaxID=1447944 RepID=A0A6A4I2D9_9AGAR|nr:hypothetical protein BT96DRAFT_964644 [Gymnopus androsaceus JB14]